MEFKSHHRGLGMSWKEVLFWSGLVALAVFDLCVIYWYGNGGLQ